MSSLDPVVLTAMAHAIKMSVRRCWVVGSFSRQDRTDGCAQLFDMLSKPGMPPRYGVKQLELRCLTN